MGTRYNCFITLTTGLAVCGALLAGCQTRPEPDADKVLEQAATQVSSPAPDPRVRRAQVIADWLSEGDRALSDDRLLTPPESNAYERYRAVLYLDPGNVRAQSGLQAIALRYLELARSAATRGAFEQAQELLERADTVDPGNALAAELAEDLAKARERQRQSEPLTQSGDSYLLNPYRLAQRDQSLIEELHKLARRAAETEEFVLIVSRTDAEGRWIYQQMREAVPGYLLRGDINLGSPPKIQLLPPI